MRIHPLFRWCLCRRFSCARRRGGVPSHSGPRVRSVYVGPVLLPAWGRRLVEPSLPGPVYRQRRSECVEVPVPRSLEDRCTILQFIWQSGPEGPRDLESSFTSPPGLYSCVYCAETQVGRERTVLTLTVILTPTPTARN